MTTLLQVYQECDRDGIDVDYFPMREAVAIALPDGCIALDVDKIENSAEEKVILAHEKAHIDLGAFYNLYSPLDLKSKHEYKVKKRTIKKLVPLDELQEAIDSGIVESWELAEYFDVPEDFMLEAMQFYQDNASINHYKGGY